MAKEKDDLDSKLDALTSNKIVEDNSIELSEKEKIAIEIEVKAEVAKELKAEKRKEFKAAAKQRLKKQALFQAGRDEEGDETELVLVTLAPHMPFIKLDNNVYYPGRAYRLSAAKAAVLKEQMFRGDLHDNEISGKNMKAFYGHRPSNTILSPHSHIPGGIN